MPSANLKRLLDMRERKIQTQNITIAAQAALIEELGEALKRDPIGLSNKSPWTLGSPQAKALAAYEEWKKKGAKP